MPAQQLVGRDVELACVIEALQAGAPVVIVGEAGIGKSVLARSALGAAGLSATTAQCFRATQWMAGTTLMQSLRRQLPLGDAEWTAGWVADSIGSDVFHIDDLQWADTLTLSSVALLSRVRPVAATMRTGEPGTAAARAALAEVGAVFVDLDVLTPDVAAALAKLTEPGLTDVQAAELAGRAGGNPLLIQELAAHDEPTLGLRRTVVARLRRLGEQAWTGFAMLAIAERPLTASNVPGLESLVGANLVVLDGGSVQPRHPLLAEVVAAELEDSTTDEVPGLHRRLAVDAEAAGDDGLAARHWAAGGDRERARGLALAAASSAPQPGDRAELMHLAAMCSEGPGARQLALDAVAGLVDAGAFERARELLETTAPDGTPAARARWYGLRGTVRWNSGDDEGAISDLQTGMELAPSGTPEAVLLAVEHARAVVISAGAGTRGLELARMAYAAAVTTGYELARATATLGSAEAYFDVPEAPDHLRQGVELAAVAGDVALELRAAGNYAAALEGAGRGAEAVSVAREFALRAGELRLRGWQDRLQAVALDIAIRVGDNLLEIVDEARAVLARSLELRTVDDVEVPLALALIDLGRTDEAIGSLRPPPADPHDDNYGFGRTWAHAEAHLWAGNPAEAARLAQRAIDGTSDDWRLLLPAITLGHARVGLGIAPSAGPWPTAQMALLAAAPVELAALAAQLDDPQRAGVLFGEAAVLWDGMDRRAALRCRWLAADLDPSPESAVQALQLLEAELASLGMEPLLRRVRRSLRTRGVHRAAPRGQAGTLTAREREVLDLVAAGLTTRSISARLGVAPSTVSALITSARRKLGAVNRVEAAARAEPS